MPGGDSNGPRNWWEQLPVSALPPSSAMKRPMSYRVGDDAATVARRSTVAVSADEVQPSIRPPAFTMIDVMLTSFAVHWFVSPVTSSTHVCACARPALTPIQNRPASNARTYRRVRPPVDIVPVLRQSASRRLWGLRVYFCSDKIFGLAETSQMQSRGDERG
jgi:hypothetical protein